MQNENIKEKTCTEASQFENFSLSKKQIEIGRKILELIEPEKLSLKETYDMLSELSQTIGRKFICSQKYIVCVCGRCMHSENAEYCGICGRSLK